MAEPVFWLRGVRKFLSSVISNTKLWAGIQLIQLSARRKNLPHCNEHATGSSASKVRGTNASFSTDGPAAAIEPRRKQIAHLSQPVPTQIALDRPLHFVALQRLTPSKFISS
jgi:hypothetical protein